LNGYVLTAVALGLATAAAAGRRDVPFEPGGLRQAQAARVAVGPNLRVSEPGVSHVETYIAAHPQYAANLIIVASHDHGPDALHAEALVTGDSGRTWSVVPLLRGEGKAVERLRYTVDNWVTFGPDGGAYLVTLGAGEASHPWGSSPMLVYRSSNRGVAWAGPTVLPGNAYDQPKIVAGGSAADPRLYIAVLAVGRDQRVFASPVEGDGVALLISTDRARSFTRMAFIAPDNLAHQAYVPAVLPDGSLLVPYSDYPVIGVDELAAIRRDTASQMFNAARAYVARSPNGGQSFDAPRFLGDVPRMFVGGLELAVDTSGGSFRGRVYAAWNGGPSDARDVTVARSTDGGRRWSKTRFRAEGAGPAHFYSLAVSRRGVLGVTWVQHESQPGRAGCYRIYFAASVDGGVSFTQPTAVSDAVSCPTAEGNPRTIGRWARGNDYMGMAVAVDGTFHPVWVDARTGVYEVYTSRIRVQP